MLNYIGSACCISVSHSNTLGNSTIGNCDTVTQICSHFNVGAIVCERTPKEKATINTLDHCVTRKLSQFTIHLFWLSIRSSSVAIFLDVCVRLTLCLVLFQFYFSFGCFFFTFVYVTTSLLQLSKPL